MGSLGVRAGPYMRRMTFYPPAGMRHDTSVPEQCTASDFELSMNGPAACPEGSLIGEQIILVEAGLDVVHPAVHPRVRQLRDNTRRVSRPRPLEERRPFLVGRRDREPPRHAAEVQAFAVDGELARTLTFRLR